MVVEIKKVLAVFGTRPEAIKMAPVLNALKLIRSIQTEICVTGQHRHMLDQVLDAFDIIPDFDMNLMKPGQDLTDITTRILLELRSLFAEQHYDLLLVHGDTTSAMAASLAGFYAGIPVAHVEAGLRTGNMYAPWPEEINRSIIGRIATLHFAPTEHARQFLIKEGIDTCSIHVTGNTVIDALQQALTNLKSSPAKLQHIEGSFDFLEANKRIILVTSHRRENFGNDLARICAAMKCLSERNDVQIVYPVHLNPAVLLPVHQILRNQENIHLLGPQDYLPFIYLMSRTYMILTDSGGIQEEAAFLGKPVLVLRATTERSEAIDTGAVKLVGTDHDTIVREALHLLDDDNAYHAMANASNPFGDGLASGRIVNAIQKFVGTN